MDYRLLGKSGLRVSSLSLGASSLGGVFHPVDEAEAIRAVHAALDLGINYFDVAPAYGGTRAETVLGKALKGIERSRYVLSTKVGKYTDPLAYGNDTFDYSRARVRRSLEESLARLGTDHVDILYVHDIEHQGLRHVERALTEGFEAVCELKREGRTRAVGFGIYPVDLWRRIFAELPIDAALVHNHHGLHDTRLLDLLSLAQDKGIGIVNASPFGMGILTDEGPPLWHPAPDVDRAVFRKAVEHCRSRGTPLAKIALRFSCGNPSIPTTMFSAADPEVVRANVATASEPQDADLLAQVRALLAPVINRDWE
jgi:L-galactose dehydrogenase